MLECKITGLKKVNMTDRKTFSTHERRIIADYSAFTERTWCNPEEKLVRSYGQSDEGESWFVLSKDTPEGVSNLVALSIEVAASNSEAANGELKNYRKWCYSRYLEFQADDLLSLIEASHSDGVFEKFMEYHQSTTSIHEGKDNVIQLISAS
jgi:hypothetical protein